MGTIKIDTSRFRSTHPGEPDSQQLALWTFHIAEQEINFWGRYSVAEETARYFAQHTGLLVGGSTGGVLYKALEFIHSGMIAGNVVAVVADGGEKYLHTVFNEAWLKERNIIDPTVWAQLDGWLAKDVVEELPRANDRLKVA